MSDDRLLVMLSTRWYQGRGAERTIFLLAERGGPVGEVLVHRGLPGCRQQ